MTKNHSIDYANVLSDLRAKRKELDKAIASIEALNGMGLLSPTANGHERPVIIGNSLVDSRGKGAYEATADLLKLTGKSMKTKEIYDTLIQNGVIDSNTKLATVSTTLYKAIKQKSDCKIKKSGMGEWSIK